MEQIIDSARRIISKWTNTEYPLVANASIGTTSISVTTTKRLVVGDQIILKNNQGVYEHNSYTIIKIQDRNTIIIDKPIVANNWLTSDNAAIIKTLHGLYVKRIFFGDPDVISESDLPAITVFGSEKSSEWMTLDSTKERYNLTVSMYANASYHELGYRYVTSLSKIVETGLKNNIFPLVGNYKTVAIKEDIVKGDNYIKVFDTTDMKEGLRVIIEDNYTSTEAFIKSVVNADTVELYQAVCHDYNKDDAVFIMPTRFIFNSWVSDVNYGTIHKGTLLHGAKISWFAEEEEIHNFIRMEPKLL